jgi:hypothetical protein
MRFLALLAALGLVIIALTSCGGGDEESTPTTTNEAETPVAEGSVTVAETPVALVDSKYDEAWAREQVEPVLKEVYEIMLAQEWNKLYDLFSSDARAGCSRSTYVSKMAGLWLLSSAFGGEEILKASLQDLKEGKLPITLSEITKDRITYQAGDEDDDEPTTIIREDGKWKSTDPLEQDCESLDVGNGEEEGDATPTESAQSEGECFLPSGFPASNDTLRIADGTEYMTITLRAPDGTENQVTVEYCDRVKETQDLRWNCDYEQASAGIPFAERPCFDLQP